MHEASQSSSTASSATAQKNSAVLSLLVHTLGVKRMQSSRLWNPKSCSSDLLRYSLSFFSYYLMMQFPRLKPACAGFTFQVHLFAFKFPPPNVNLILFVSLFCTYCFQTSPPISIPVLLCKSASFNYFLLLCILPQFTFLPTLFTNENDPTIKAYTYTETNFPYLMNIVTY